MSRTLTLRDSLPKSEVLRRTSITMSNDTFAKLKSIASAMGYPTNNTSRMIRLAAIRAHTSIIESVMAVDDDSDFSERCKRLQNDLAEVLKEAQARRTG